MSRLTKDSSFPSTASTSQEDLENGSSSTSSRKLRVTLLSSEWKSTKGGLSTINRELAIQLAKHSNVEVSVYLPQCSEEDKRVATSHNVHLIEAEEITGFEPVDWLSSLPDNHAVDCVIGHGVHLGRQVQLIKRHCRCTWIQVVHTTPEELGMYKSYADAISKGEKKHQVEVKLCELADQVVAIGPKLAEAFSGYLRSCGKDQDVLNLTPGIFSEFVDVKQATEERRTFCVLVFGRGDNEDFQLKGYDIAAQAIAELKDKTQPYKLLFVGAPSGEEEKVKEMFLQQGIDRSQLTVRCFNESREELARLFCEADLAIMPSRTEGFGLAALEALSAGLPVLISGNSGLGEAMENVPYGTHCVVESEDPKVWAKAIRDVRKKNRKLRLKEAKVLCGEYAEMYSWQQQCDKLVERMMKISLGNTADAQDLSLNAPVICQMSGDPLHSGSFHKGPTGIQASGKGKRPLSPSAIPAPKRWLTDDCEGPAGIQASGKGKRPLSASATPAPTRRLADDHEADTDISVVVKFLKAEYNRRAQLRPLLWDNTVQLPLEHVYTRLKIVSRRKEDIEVKSIKVNLNLFDFFKAREKDDDVSMFDWFKAREKDDDAGMFDRFKAREKNDDAGVFGRFKAREKDDDARKFDRFKAREKDDNVGMFDRFEARKKNDDMSMFNWFNAREKDDDVDMFDIFKALKKGEDVMVLVEGGPGIGKTTFCLKLAYDWAHEKVSTDFSFPKFKLVLLLKCRDVDGDIMETISEQLLPDDIKKKTKKRLFDFIKDIHNQEKTLIILDGLDELPQKSQHHVDKLLRRRILPFCYVLATTRQEGGIEVRKMIHFDIHLEIKGFTESDAFEYVKKHFENVGPGHSSKGERLIEEIKENTFLHALRNNPLNLLLLCVIYEDYEGELPTSRTELYQVIVQCLLRRYCAKRNLKAHEDNQDLEKQFKEDILALGKLAWECLLNDRHSFREDKLTKLERRNKKLVAREIGLLFKEESLKRLKPQHEYHFLHKTFQEYLAASYVAHKLRRKQFNLFEQLSFDDLVEKYPQVFLFVCGILGEEASILFTQIGEELKSSGDWDWHNCSEEAANFLTEGFSESGNAELMAVTLCSLLPFPQNIPKITSNFIPVLKACKGFSTLEKPVALIVPYEDSEGKEIKLWTTALNDDTLMARIVDVMESCSQLRTVSLSITNMTSVNGLLEGLSVCKCLSEFSLRVRFYFHCDAAALIGKELAAHQTLTKVTLALPGKCGEACFNAFETGLSTDSSLSSIGLQFYSPVSDTAIKALVKILSNTLKSLSLVICGDMQDSLAAALMKALAGQNVLNSLDLRVNGKLSFSGANLLEKGVLENSSLNDLRVSVRGKLPGNWHNVVENLRLTKKALVTCAFHPNTWVKVADNQMSHFRPAVVEEGLVPKQHLTVNLWGELSCEGTEALCEVLVRFSLSSLTLNFHGKLTDSVADCFARCCKPHKALSSLTINIWGELTTDGSTVLQGLSDNNLTVWVNVHDVGAVPDESNNVLEVSIDRPASLAPLFSKVKDTRKDRLSLTINNHSDGTYDWTQHLGDALAENRSLTALDLTINNYMMNADVGKGLGESILQSTSLTSFSLTINNNNVTGGWDCILGDNLSKMALLTTLSLVINDHSKESGLRGKCLSDSLIAIKSLSTFSIVINGRNMDGFWSVVLRNCLEQNTSLKKLCLTVNNYEEFETNEEESLEYEESWRQGLRDGLATTTSLNELTLAINSIGVTNHHWAMFLSFGLSQNKSLTALTVTVTDYQDLSDGYWVHQLIKGLSENNSITTLTLTVNDYDDGVQRDDWDEQRDYWAVQLRAIEGLGDSLAVNTSLTTVNLTGSRCSEASENWFPYLCNLFMTCSSLTTLRLQVNNQCATSGSRIYDFSKLLTKCRSLSLLDLTVSFYGNENEC